MVGRGSLNLIFSWSIFSVVLMFTCLMRKVEHLFIYLKNIIISIFSESSIYTFCSFSSWFVGLFIPIFKKLFILKISFFVWDINIYIQIHLKFILLMMWEMDLILLFFSYGSPVVPSPLNNGNLFFPYWFEMLPSSNIKFFLGSICEFYILFQWPTILFMYKHHPVLIMEAL